MKLEVDKYTKITEIVENVVERDSHFHPRTFRVFRIWFFLEKNTFSRSFPRKFFAAEGRKELTPA